MAKLERLSPSAHVLELKSGTRVLFSYDTPVAAQVAGNHRGHVNPNPDAFWDWLRADAFYSRTTSGHVARFLGDNPARKVAPAVILALVEGV